jgi:hypothetical protein
MKNRVLWWCAAAVWSLVAGVALGQTSPDCDGWVPMGEPSGRSRFAAAYDSDRGRICVFGGMPYGAVSTGQPDETSSILYFQSLSMGDYWEWDGEQWYSFELDGVLPRIDAAMAYDAARHELVMFGGMVWRDSPSDVHMGTISNEMWVRRDGVWSRRVGSGPSPRTLAAVAYDAPRQRVVLFGGVSRYTQIHGGPPRGLTDMWEWDGSQWLEIPRSLGAWPPAMTAP